VEATTTPQATRSALSQAEVAALIEEIRFYLQHNLWDEAETAINKCAAQVPGSPELAQLREQLAAGRNPVPKAAPVRKQTAPPPRQKNALGDLASDLEESLPPTFAIGGPAAVPQTIHAAGMSAGAAVQPALAHPFAESLDAPAAPVRPTDLGVPAGATTQAETSLPLSSQPGLGSELADLFSEFKEDLEEKATASESEDPETHYNLGVAFREMGLLDEAIGELQKVCQAIEHGYKFSHVLQAFTWLAQCFLDKEVPQAAVRWYQKALELPGVDDEARTALHYEIASAFEGAGDKGSALKHFMEVYGSNIDYRDVAERIKALKS
jgi:tetratricopeptide (TPR) repeat protein